jgi:23S rRNA (guanosine2251-2'-O)-methyltransferase
VTEALKAGRVDRLLVSETAVQDKVIKALLERAQAAGVAPERVGTAQLDRLAPGVVHQGVVALCEPRTYWTLDEILARAREKGEDPFLLLLDGVEDPHNLGAILRVADGAGCHGVVIPGRGATGLTPTVFKASAGAAEHVPVAQVGNLTDAVLHLKREEVWVGVAEANQGRPYYEERLKGPLALVLGSEGAGVSRPVAKHADFALHIPLKGQVNSLNVSVAAAILAFERVRQTSAREPRPRKEGPRGEAGRPGGEVK